MHRSIVTFIFLIIFLTPIVVGIPHVCESSLDCSLNGDCIKGFCICDKAWQGKGSVKCDVLSLEPTPIDSGETKYIIYNRA